jgi:hypothetical protein
VALDADDSEEEGEISDNWPGERPGMGILFKDAQQGPNVLLCMPNRTKWILDDWPGEQLHRRPCLRTRPVNRVWQASFGGSRFLVCLPTDCSLGVRRVAVPCALEVAASPMEGYIAEVNGIHLVLFGRHTRTLGA